jgi:hypothetical protein
MHASFGILNLGDWDLFGICFLVLGIFATLHNRFIIVNPAKNLVKCPSPRLSRFPY